MKKRVLSALMAVGLACSLVVTAFATADVSTTPAPTAAVESQNTETESSDPAAEADPTETPAETPAATQEPTPAPEESTPAPSEEPASSATPEPTAEPSAAPDDTVTATPTPTPEATAAPTPEATEEPAAAEPTAEPEATAEPAADNSADGIEYTAALEQDGQALNVIVTAPADAFGEDVSLEVAAIENTDETDAIAAELDESGLTYDGFAAMDISFKNAAGEEVEPSAPVTVRIELPDSIVDSGIDLNTLAVQHLAEDADGNVTAVEQVASVADGSIALSEEAQAAMEAQAAENAADDAATTDEAAGVAPMMLAANNAQTDATAEAAAVAEFEVDGFSRFTITWSRYGEEANVNFVYWNSSNSSELEVDNPIKVSNKLNSGDTISFSDTTITIDGTSYSIAQRVTVDGKTYEYTDATYGRNYYNGTWQDSGEITKLEVSYRTGFGGGWRYYVNDSENRLNYTPTIHLNYSEVQEPTSFYIAESVANDGRFTAVFPKGSAPELSEGQSIQYTWKRALDEDGLATAESIVYTKVIGSNYNMAAENGTAEATWVNVALDSDVAGAANDQRYWYQVTAQVVNSDGTEVDGQTYTASLQVPYYIQLQNGGFEKPNIEDYTHSNSDHQWQLANGAEELIWQSTGTAIAPDGGSQEGQEVAIELLRTETEQQSQNAQTYHHAGQDDEESGYQYAELNCEAYGALYQEVMTVPGSTLNWAFSHLPREVKTTYGSRKGDTMALVIMPSSAADEYIDRLQENSNNSKEIDEILTEIAGKGEGFFVQRETSNYLYNEDGSQAGEHERYAWNRYNGTYTVGKDQYLTTFFFVAVETASGDKTVGNLLDRVYFTTDALPVDPDSANLTVTKKVEGIDLSLEENSDYQVTVTVKDGDTVIGEHVFAANNFDQNGEASWTLHIDNIPVGGTKNLTVTESATDLSGEYEVKQTVQVGDNEATEGTQTDIQISGNNDYAVKFANKYTEVTPPEPVTPEYHKYIKDNQDGTYDLSLDVHGTIREDQENPTKVDIVYVLDLSYSMMWEMDGSYPGGSENTSGDDEGYNYSYARYKAAANAIQTLNGALAENTGLDVQAALVTFAPEVISSTNGYVNIDNGDSLELPDAKWETFSSGTNYGAALNSAKDLLESARSDAQKVVIFITDGEPNRALDENGNTVSANANTGTRYAEDEVADLVANRFYAVGVGSDTYEQYLQRVVKAAQNVEETKYIAAEDHDTLAELFEEIAADITSVDCTNVVITDTLSQYAKLTENATFRITVTNALGVDVVVNEGQPISIEQASASSGADASFTAGSGESVTLNVKYTAPTSGDESTNGTFTLTFPETYALENGWVYTITTTVEPTDTAYDEYGAAGNTFEGYPVKGDPNTDAVNNDTSSNKPGFYSNNEATLTYTSAEQAQTKDYPKPVIQVKNGSLTIDKSIVSNESNFDVTSLGDVKFTFEVQGPEAVKGMTYGDVTFDATGKATVTIEKDGQITITDLPAGDYTVTETNKPDSVDGNYYCSGTTYQIDSGSKNQEPLTATLEAGKTTVVTVENTYTKYRTVTITKQVDGEMGDTTKPFNFTTLVSRGDDNEVKISGTQGDSQDKVFELGSDTISTKFTEAQLGTGEEKSAVFTTTGYTLADGESITISKLKDNDTMTLAESEANQGGYVTSYIVGDVTQTSWSGEVIVNGDMTITVTNTRKVVPPTGLESNHTTPYGLMVGAAGVAGAALVGSVVVRRRRRRQE